MRGSIGAGFWCKSRSGPPHPVDGIPCNGLRIIRVAHQHKPCTQTIRKPRAVKAGISVRKPVCKIINALLRCSIAAYRFYTNYNTMLQCIARRLDERCCKLLLLAGSSLRAIPHNSKCRYGLRVESTAGTWYNYQTKAQYDEERRINT